MKVVCDKSDSISQVKMGDIIRIDNNFYIVFL